MYQVQLIFISHLGYLRGVEHLRALERNSKHSVLYRHIASDHREEEEKVDFKMQVTGRFKDCLSRQISEGLAIRNKPQETLLNSKSEFYGPSVKQKIYVD